MPKPKPFEQTIEAMYKIPTIDSLMYGYVSALRNHLPGTSVDKCIILFLARFGFEEDDFPFQTAYRTYYRIQKLYIKEGK